MTSSRPITEVDLHAYVDAALDPERRAEVETYLARHPDIADRIHGYTEQQTLLREALDPIAEEPVPPELNLAQLIESAQMTGMRHRPSRLALWRIAAAVLLVFGLGSSSGWLLRGMTQPPTAGIAALAREAATNYAVYGPDQAHPVEFQPANATTFVNWISQRLGHLVAVPDLTASGYHFMGGRLVATDHGPAGLFLYDNDHGTRLMMFVRSMEIQQTMPMSHYAEGSVDGFSWAAKGLGYSLVGTAAPDVLHPIANEVRRQVGDGI